MKRTAYVHLRILPVILMAVLYLMASCNSRRDQKHVSVAENALDNMEKTADRDPGKPGGNTCLLGYQDKYDRLIEEKHVLAITGFSKDVMETKYSNALKNPANHSFEYRFRNGRIGKTFGFDKEIELKDIVKVSSIRPMSLKQFKDSYRVVTEEEMAKAREALTDAADGKSSDPDARAALQKAKDHQVSSETVKKVGGGVLDAIKEVSKANTDVPDLGDAAVWNTVTDDLYVLQNGVKVEIKASVSNDKGKNKAAAMELAGKILGKCD